MKKKKRILILCVDSDNDIGVKTGINTPIIGREDNLKAATTLALKDPEESDANAIFGALRTYENLSNEQDSEEYLVATIVGSEMGGVKSDKRITDQLLSVLERYPSENVILVTDGFSDEKVIPIIQSHVPILSLRRIIVKQSESIEESWAVFTRYLAKLAEDPYYSRWALGAPGILLLALAILLYVGPQYVGIVFLIFLGSLLVIKGFSIDKKIEQLIFPSPPNLIRLFTAAAALIIVGVDSYQTYTGLINTIGEPNEWLKHVPEVIGYSMKYATDLGVVASCIFLIGIAFYFFFFRDPRFWWTLVGTISILWMREVSLNASEVLLEPATSVQNLIIVIGFGIATTVITILVTHKLSKRFESYFNRYEVQRIEEG